MLNEVKTIIEGIGLTYYRALDTKDLNEIAINNNMLDIGVLAGLIEIEAELSENSNQSLEVWSYSVLFLTLSPNIDATATQIDVKLEALLAKVHDFLSEIQNTLPPGHYLDEYSIKSTDAINITTEVLIGWELKLSIPHLQNLC